MKADARLYLVPHDFSYHQDLLNLLQSTRVERGRHHPLLAIPCHGNSCQDSNRVSMPEGTNDIFPHLLLRILDGGDKICDLGRIELAADFHTAQSAVRPRTRARIMSLWISTRRRNGISLVGLVRHSSLGGWSALVGRTSCYHSVSPSQPFFKQGHAHPETFCDRSLPLPPGCCGSFGLLGGRLLEGWNPQR